MNTPFVLHIDIDAFFAAVEVMLNPQLRGKPVIIGGMPDERGVVSTASYEARQYGVHSGMALRTAGQKCPHGVFLRGRHQVYSRVSDSFVACLRRFSPRVEAVSIDEAYMDLSGCSYLSASVYDLAERIKQAVERETGLSVSGGLAFSKLGAKLATEMAKPGGLFFVGDESTFIENLSLEKVPGIGQHTLLILNGMGIRRVKELERVYPAIWKRLIAPHLYSRSRYPAQRAAKTKSFSRETTFREDISDKDMIISHLAYLVDRLSVYLIEKKYYAGRVEVKIRFSDFSTFTKRMMLPFPTFGYSNIWEVALSLLEKLMRKKRLPARLVGVKVEDIVRHRDIMPFISIRSEQLSQGVSDIKKRFGFSSIFTARELMLEKIYPVERDSIVLKTASLTK
ncbi:MAG: DNA polymerase IV [bacterium]|nr:DNA polymerase IV [bacterium]